MNGNSNSIIGLSYGNPWNPATWSNNPYYLFSNLKQMGLLKTAWGENPSKWRTRLSKIQAMLRFANLNKSVRGHLAVRKFSSRQMNKKFVRFLNEKRAEWQNDNLAVLSTSSFVHFENIDYPIYLYGDQTFYQAYKGNVELQQSISTRALQEIIEYEKEQGKRYAGIFCFSEWMKEAIVNDYGMEESRVHAVGHGYCLPDVEDFEKSDFEEPILLFVVTNWHKKGGDLVLKVYNIVKSEIPDLQLHIVGKVPEGVLKQIDNERKIYYHGFLNKNNRADLEQLITLYKKAAVFILPSVYDPMPNITLEANLLKTPAVTSNVCGIPEQVIDGQTGFVIEKFAPDLYAEKILCLLKNRDMRYEMGQKARNFVMQNYSWKAVIDKMTQVMFLEN